MRRRAGFVRPGGLWQHADFLRLWGARTVSSFGTQVSLLAIPLTAIVTLDATPAEVGLLAASATLPFPLFGLFAAARIVYSTGTVIYDITQVSFRQAVTPDALLGRMNATIRVVIWGTLPLGSLLGGVLGDLLGPRLALAVAAAGMYLAVLWVVLSDVRGLRSAAVRDFETT